MTAIDVVREAEATGQNYHGLSRQAGSYLTIRNSMWTLCAVEARRALRESKENGGFENRLKDWTGNPRRAEEFIGAYDYVGYFAGEYRRLAAEIGMPLEDRLTEEVEDRIAALCPISELEKVYPFAD